MDPYVAARAHMVQHHLAESFDGRPPITDPRVLEVMGRIPRERLVPADLRDRAYDDRPLSIGHGQTISQPYIGRMVIPVGGQWTDQDLQVYERTSSGTTTRPVMRVRFVPLTGG